MKIYVPPRNIIGLFSLFIFGALAGFLLLKEARHEFVLQNQQITSISSRQEPELRGQAPIPSTNENPNQACLNPARRFIAVMLAGDPITRPLSGIAKADIVIEMPVITGSITRFLAFFGCENVPEIGSIRSARDDFIPLAAAFDAVYAHWGGSHFALDKLRAGIIENIDALQNPYGAFFRKRGIAAPHNGFSSTDRLYYAAEKLGYRLEKSFEDYPRSSFNDQLPITNEIVIGYPGPFRIEWRHNPSTGLYERWRGGISELDEIDGTQVAVANVIIMKTTSRQIEGQYNDVRIFGNGEAFIFRGGRVFNGAWSKDQAPFGSRLRLLDAEGEDVQLAPGKIWIVIADQTATINYY